MYLTQRIAVVYTPGIFIIFTLKSPNFRILGQKQHWSVFAGGDAPKSSFWLFRCENMLQKHYAGVEISVYES